jgi:two-component system sensor histidine kinase UhpB
MNQGSVLVTLIVTFVLIVATLVTVLVGSAVVQRRRYLRTRDHLGARLLTAQDEERAAIARDLHDDVVQRLIAATVRVRGLGNPGAAKVADEFDGVVEDLRGMARGLHPTAVEQAGLDAALRDLCVGLSEREDIQVDYSGPSAPDSLLPRERLALYRVAQEALGNVARHAEVTRATVTLTIDETGTTLLIADAGGGFDPRKAVRGAGLGVTSMHERVELLGGTLQIDSAPGKGTQVTALLKERAGAPKP